MAIETLSDIEDALSQRFAPEISRQWNRTAVLASSVPTEANSNGKNVSWDAEMDGAVAYNAEEAQVITTSLASADPVVPAILPWSIYQSTFALTETEMDAAMQSMGSATAIENILKERILGAGAKVASLFNVDCWTGDGTAANTNVNVVGVTGGAMASTGFYATINRSTYPEWAGNTLANGGVARPLTTDLLAHGLQVIFERSNQRPTHAVCDTGTFRKYKGLFEAIRRVEGEGPMGHYDTSTSNLFFEGLPILQDKDAPAGTFFWANSNYIKKVYLPSSSSSNADGANVGSSELSGSDGVGEVNPVAVPLRIVALGRTGDFVQFYVKSVLNVKFSRPNTCAVITDIAV